MKCTVANHFLDRFLPGGKASRSFSQELPYVYVAGTSAPDGFYAKLPAKVAGSNGFGGFGEFGFFRFS